MSDQTKFQIREVLFWVTLALTAGIAIYVLALSIWPYTPLKIDSMTLNKTQVCRGGEVCFQFAGEKFYNMPVEVVVELVNGERYQVMQYTSNTPKGRVFKQRCFNVPYHVKPNKYEVVWSGKYEMNSFNTVFFKQKSGWIEVAAPQKKLEK